MTHDGLTHAFIFELAKFLLYERSLAVAQTNDDGTIQPDAPFAAEQLASLRESSGD